MLLKHELDGLFASEGGNECNELSTLMLGEGGVI